MTTQRVCAQCGKTISRYNDSSFCFEHDKRTDLPTRQICAACGENDISPNRANSICATCENKQARDVKARQKARAAKIDFRVAITKSDAQPVENPTAQDILQIVADAYSIPLDQITSAGYRGTKVTWARYLAIYLITEDLDIHRPRHMRAALPELTLPALTVSRRRIEEVLGEPTILNTINKIRTRFCFSGTKALVPP
mgnify:CR=1 FL=1